MKLKLLRLYQLLTGLSDTATGAMLILAPSFTLRLMHLQAPADALVYLSYIGAFVLSVGIACLYGAHVVHGPEAAASLQTVWVLTAVTRAIIAFFVVAKVATGQLPLGWLTVAATDGAFALLQTIGLSNGWLDDVLA